MTPTGRQAVSHRCTPGQFLGDGWMGGGQRDWRGGGRKRSDSPTCRTYLASVVTKAEVLNQSFWSVCFEKSLCFWMQQICGGFAEVLHLCFPD